MVTGNLTIPNGIMQPLPNSYYEVCIESIFSWLIPNSFEVLLNKMFTKLPRSVKILFTSPPTTFIVTTIEVIGWVVESSQIFGIVFSRIIRVFSEN